MNINIKNTSVIIMFSFLLISCKEKKENQNRDNMNILNQAPYNLSDEGDGKEFNYDTLSKEYIDKAKKILSIRGFKFSDDLTFKNKIEEVYKLDITKYNSKIIALRSAMFPEVAIISDKYIFVQDEEFENNDFINDEFLFYYNNYIFQNSKVSFEILRAKYPESLKDLVVVFGYVADDKLAKFVLEKYNYKSFEEFKNLIFDKKNNIYSLRENVLDKIILYNYNGKTEDFSYAKEGNGFLRINNIVEFIDNNSHQFLNFEKTIAVLFEKELEVGITGDIEAKLKSDKNYKHFLIKNNYFGFERIENYIKYLYEENPNSLDKEIAYKIQDIDGYTNLRKAKNSSSDIIEKIKSGEKIEIIENLGDWWLIQTKEGKRGYVYKSKIVSE